MKRRQKNQKNESTPSLPQQQVEQKQIVPPLKLSQPTFTTTTTTTTTPTTPTITQFKVINIKPASDYKKNVDDFVINTDLSDQKNFVKIHEWSKVGKSKLKDSFGDLLDKVKNYFKVNNSSNISNILLITIFLINKAKQTYITGCEVFEIDSILYDKSNKLKLMFIISVDIVIDIFDILDKDYTISKDFDYNICNYLKIANGINGTCIIDNLYLKGDGFDYEKSDFFKFRYVDVNKMIATSLCIKIKISK